MIGGAKGIAVEQAQPWRGIPDTMTTRGAVIVTIGLIAALMVGVAVAALFAGDISERAGGIVTSVLGSLATVLAGLLLFLRVETVNGRVETLDQKADDAVIEAAAARREAQRAATNAAVAAQKTAEVHHDILNGGLRENVKRAVREVEADPAIVEQRIEITQKGVQRDRHDKAQRDTVDLARRQLRERGAIRDQEPSS